MNSKYVSHYIKILKCIESCNTIKQIKSIRNMLENYFNISQDYDSTGDLWIKYNLKFFDIKNEEK